ncbi:DNA polymerase I [Actinotignum sp. GS-2025b]|uniref:DNA polymerase I n=1 Tax=Actinotignum sp. GS-2025b TaxID=3427275 RepID=UPI003F47D2BD
MSDEKFLLVDGHSMAFRAFYALRAENFLTDRGQYTNAVYGFLSTLLKIIGDYHPDYIAVAFDLPGGTFRTRVYPDYKAGRAPTPVEFAGQIDVIKSVLDTCGISWLTYEDYEADDIIATLSRRAVDHGADVYIASGDKDSYQLVDEHTTVLYPMPRSAMQVLDPAGIEKKTGVRPERYADLAALVGEGADNIPGVPGVGPKTAAKWLANYGDLDSILARADDIGGKVGASLREHLDQVRQNRSLNTLVRDLPIGENLEEFRPRGVDREALHELFDTLDFDTLRGRVLSELPSRDGAPQSDAPAGFTLAGLEITTSGVRAWLDQHADAPFFGLDIAGPASPGAGRVEAMAIGTAHAALLLDTHTMNEEDTAQVRAWLESDAPKVVHGAKEAWHRVRGQGAELRGVVRDTVLCAYLLYPDQRSYDLGDLALRHLGVDLGDGGMLPGLDGQADPLAARAALLGPLSEKLLGELTQRGEDGALLDLEMDVARTLARMEDTGIAVDAPYLEKLRKDFDGRVEAAARLAYDAIGHKVNLSSPKQLQGVLFDELGLPTTRKTRSGYTTNAEALADLAVRIAPREDDKAVAGTQFLGALLEHRDAIKLRQSVEGLQRNTRADGKIHTTYQQAVAATGRLSSTDPNLQNIHARTAEGLQIRSAFIPSEGYAALMTADYSQIEMRIMASLSGDEALITAFIEGEDLHSSVASLVFGIPESEVSSQQRSRIKAMSYGLAYGLSAYGLSRQLHISAHDAQELMDSYFARFGKVRDYLDSLVVKAREDGYTQTLLGRRRYLPELRSTNRQLREASERMALNAPIQGSAADIIKIAMVAVVEALREAGLRSRVLLQVHDELVLEVAPGEHEAAEEIVRREMAGAAQLRVPLSVGVGYGPNWREAAH